MPVTTQSKKGVVLISKDEKNARYVELGLSGPFDWALRQLLLKYHFCV